MVRGFSYRLNPTSEQAALMAQSVGCARLVYNTSLDQRILAWSLYHTGVNTSLQAAEWNRLKRTPGYEWLADVHSDVIQQALRDLDTAYRNFWAGRTGYPRFKKRGRGQQSFRYQQRRSGQGKSIEVRKLNRHWAEVKLPKLGWVRFRYSRKLQGEIKNVTIVQKASSWEIRFACDTGEAPAPAREDGTAVGIDAGVIVSFATSEGELHNAPKPSKGEKQRRLALERKHVRQTRGSNRWRRTKQQLAELSERDARRRKDFLHKLTTDLVSRFALIGIEDLNITAMTKSASGTVEDPGTNVAQKRGLNRAILENNWGMFRMFLEYKREERGSRIVAVPPAHTSQECSRCGHMAKDNRESQAIFHCQNCDYEANADVNASRNILTDAQVIAAGQAVSARRRNPMIADPRTSLPDAQAA